MIEYDYLIKRDENDETRTYVPKLPKELDDICLIEGPNSSGKSTLLHIIALAMNGKDNPSVCKALKEKMHRLLESDRQEMTFNFTIDNKQSGLRIHAVKESPTSPKIDLWEYEDGNKVRLSSELFNRKYNLIYDIPSNPTARLKDLTHDLQDKHHLVGRKLNDLRQTISDVISEILNSRDPKHLESIERQISKVESDMSELSKRTRIQDEHLKRFKQFAYAKLFSQNHALEKRLRDKLTQLKKEQRSVKREKTSKDKEVTKLQADARAEAIIVRDSRNGAYHKLKQIMGPSPRLEAWSNLNIQECLFHPSNSDLLSEGIEHFKTDLLGLQMDLSRSENVEQAEFYHELLMVLSGHSSLSVEIPGTDKKVSDLIEIIRNTLDELTPDKQRLEDVKKALQYLKHMEEALEHFVKTYLPRIKDILKHLESDEEEFTDEIYRHDELIKEVTSRLNQQMKTLLKYRDMCIQVGLKEEFILQCLRELEEDNELKIYSRYSEIEFNSYITDYEKRFNKDADNLLRMKEKLARLSRQKAEMLQKKTHKYQHIQSEVNALYGVVEALEQKIRVTCPERLKKLPDLRDTTGLSDDEIAFYDSVACYLGQKVASVRHVDGEYDVTKIDMIKGVIHTVSGKMINLLDMGTGQSQGAYLQGILATNDNKKIIALIDEVAMMDTKTITPVIKRLRALYQSGKLVCGIVVQRSDSLRTQSLIGEVCNEQH